MPSAKRSTVSDGPATRVVNRPPPVPRGSGPLPDASPTRFVVGPKLGKWPLPAGATIIDCAYAVDIPTAETCVGARINGEKAPLKAVPRTGDLVELLTSDDATPSPAWIAFAQSPARELIAVACGLPLSTEEFSVYSFLAKHGVDYVPKQPIPDEAKREATGRKSPVQANREGKKLIGAYIDKDDVVRLKAMLSEQGLTVQDFFADAVARALAATPAQRARMVNRQVARFRKLLDASLK